MLEKRNACITNRIFFLCSFLFKEFLKNPTLLYSSLQSKRFFFKLLLLRKKKGLYNYYVFFKFFYIIFIPK